MSSLGSLQQVDGNILHTFCCPLWVYSVGCQAVGHPSLHSSKWSVAFGKTLKTLTHTCGCPVQLSEGVFMWSGLYRSGNETAPSLRSLQREQPPNRRANSLPHPGNNNGNNNNNNKKTWLKEVRSSADAAKLYQIKQPQNDSFRRNVWFVHICCKQIFPLQLNVILSWWTNVLQIRMRHKHAFYTK